MYNNNNTFYSRQQVFVLFVRFSVVSSRLMAFKTDELAFSKTFAN